MKGTKPHQLAWVALWDIARACQEKDTIPLRDIRTIRSECHILLAQGYTIPEVIRHGRNWEDVNPFLDEEEALKRMRINATQVALRSAREGVPLIDRETAYLSLVPFPNILR